MIIKQAKVAKLLPHNTSEKHSWDFDSDLLTSVKRTDVWKLVNVHIYCCSGFPLKADIFMSD